MTNRERMKAAVANRPVPPAAAPAPAEPQPPPAAPPAKKKPKPSYAQRLQARQEARGRLPHGSRFEATYDAEATRWRGTLALTRDGVPALFESDSSGVWKLMAKLDTLYRDWLAARAAAAPAPG